MAGASQHPGVRVQASAQAVATSTTPGPPPATVAAEGVEYDGMPSFAGSGTGDHGILGAGHSQLPSAGRDTFDQMYQDGEDDMSSWVEGV